MLVVVTTTLETGLVEMVILGVGGINLWTPMAPVPVGVRTFLLPAIKTHPSVMVDRLLLGISGLDSPAKFRVILLVVAKTPLMGMAILLREAVGVPRVVGAFLILLAGARVVGVISPAVSICLIHRF
jgi:hypothetical protein